MIEENGWRRAMNSGTNWKEVMTSPSLWPRHPMFWRPEDTIKTGTEGTA